VRHVIPSIFCSLDDDLSTQQFKDYELIAEAIKFAALNPIFPDFEYANIFPGEHYRILAGLVKVLKSSTLIDIGTYRGCSSRVMLDYSEPEATVSTFDLYDYQSFD
jgi:predicted O-methyltransferase YrrM